MNEKLHACHASHVEIIVFLLSIQKNTCTALYVNCFARCKQAAWEIFLLIAIGDQSNQPKLIFLFNECCYYRIEFFLLRVDWIIEKRRVNASGFFSREIINIVIRIASFNRNANRLQRRTNLQTWIRLQPKLKHQLTALTILASKHWQHRIRHMLQALTNRAMCLLSQRRKLSRIRMYS